MLEGVARIGRRARAKQQLRLFELHQCREQRPSLTRPPQRGLFVSRMLQAVPKDAPLYGWPESRSCQPLQGGDVDKRHPPSPVKAG